MKQSLVFDIECYSNYFLVMFRNIENGKTISFEKYEGLTFDYVSIIRILKKYKLIGFNSKRYDILLLSLALRGADNAALKTASDDIIKRDMTPWGFEDNYNIKIPNIDHIDIIEVAPGMGSLKIYGGRLHSAKLQDLPIDPEALISPEQREELKLYCTNDLQTTIDLYRSLIPQIELREHMSLVYRDDLRSKSDAQIAEAVIRSEFKKKGLFVTKPTLPKKYKFKYTPPNYIAFSRPELLDAFRTILDVDFCLNDKGVVEMPEALKNLEVKIGDGVYRMGIGGLHSSETRTSIKTGDVVIEDRDVASYYPNIILNNTYYPKHLGEEFCTIYRNVLNERLKAKHSGDMVTANALKITLNGCYGKLGSKWSFLFSPDLLIHTTLTGQLSLLMLIEWMEDAGVKVYSANTDGIVLLYPKELEAKKTELISLWERVTNFETEGTLYSAVYSRDVNNYIAVKTDGKVKTKGAYALGGLMKNPKNNICTEAVIEYLIHNKPIEETIFDCRDIRKFLTVRKVEGGALKGNEYLGRVVRWYYAVNEAGQIQYVKNGNKVPESDGGKPLMELPESFPQDVDYARYVAEARSILAEIGA